MLRRLRVQTGLTQEELAERSGVSVRTIRGLETGSRSNPRMTTVRELAKALPLRPVEREELLGAAVRRNPDRRNLGRRRRLRDSRRRQRMTRRRTRPSNSRRPWPPAGSARRNTDRSRTRSLCRSAGRRPPRS
ncbi:helix-turn-helix transcriptional regulator [Streptomyces sp. NPDC059697]|uniref:helix-turn-helix transcriptional regulator n=1 Tax=Streptomyces sp. NPDC059697 TaxID=3346912 RepID=UPI00367DBDE9